jgi:hypothetical protein
MTLQTSPACKRNRQKRHRSSIGGSQQTTQEPEDDGDDDPTLQMRGNDSSRRTADVQFDGENTELAGPGRERWLLVVSYTSGL